MPNAVSVESRPSTVVLCKICKPFASSDEWKNAERRAQAALTLWARSHKCAILDTWRWQRDGRDSHCRYVGLARVPNNEVDLLLGASGSAGWFVDAFKTTACSPWQIEWQQREDGEDDVQYLHRLRRSHCNLGIAAGTRHLGLRHLRQADAEVTRTWVLEHVPAEWTSDDVVNLVKASFSNVYMLSRRRSGRKLCDFFFRASAKADLDLQPFVVQQEGGNVTYWAKHHISKPFVAKETKSLPANRSMDLRVKQGNCVVTKAVATSSGEGGESQQPSEREDKKDAKKQKVLTAAPLVVSLWCLSLRMVLAFIIVLPRVWRCWIPRSISCHWSSVPSRLSTRRSIQRNMLSIGMDLVLMGRPIG